MLYLKEASKPPKLVWKIFLPIIFGSIFLTIFLVIGTDMAIKFDFVSFLTGAVILRNGLGSSLFDTLTQLEVQQHIFTPFGLIIGENVNFMPFLNYPALALLFIPFSLLPYLLSYKLFASFLLIILIIFSILTVKTFKTISIYSLWFLLPILYYPSIGSVFIGQLSILLALIFLAVYKLIIDKKYLLAGFAASFLFLKFQYLVSIPLILILIKSKSLFIRGFFIGSLALFLISSFLSDFFVVDYLRFLVLAQTNSDYGLIESKFFTLYASLKQMQFFNSWSFSELLLFNLSFYSLIFFMLFKLRQYIRFEVMYALVILLTMIFCIHGVDYDQSLLLIPILILVNKFRTQSKILYSEAAVVLIIVLTPIFLILEIGIYSSFSLLTASSLLISPPFWESIKKKYISDNKKLTSLRTKH